MQQAAKLFKVLSEVTRLRILGLLQYGELCVCDLMEVLEMPQSTVSRHLARLKECGLVQDRRSTVWCYYRLKEPDSVLHSTVLQALEQDLAQTEQFQLDRQSLQEFLARKEDRHCA
ncbi:MAG: metalloregulator ArsR/SmtB family transcription factor [Desulfohalobiaceae bacterium]